MLDSYILALIIVSFITFIFIVVGIIMWVMWNRRKWIFTNFLNETGKWEKIHHKQIDKNFSYDNVLYDYSIVDCTRDDLNRPIAHYYKGNPKQQKFNYKNSTKVIEIGTEELTPSDFRQLMLTKIIKDLFSDDDFKIWFIIILIVVVVGFIITIFMLNSQSNICVLSTDNQTMNVIKDGVKLAISQ